MFKRTILSSFIQEKIETVYQNHGHSQNSIEGKFRATNAYILRSRGWGSDTVARMLVGNMRTWVIIPTLT